MLIVIQVNVHKFSLIKLAPQNVKGNKFKDIGNVRQSVKSMLSLTILSEHIVETVV